MQGSGNTINTNYPSSPGTPNEYFIHQNTQQTETDQATFLQQRIPTPNQTENGRNHRHGSQRRSAPPNLFSGAYSPLVNFNNNWLSGDNFHHLIRSKNMHQRIDAESHHIASSKSLDRVYLGTVDGEIILMPLNSSQNHVSPKKCALKKMMFKRNSGDDEEEEELYEIHGLAIDNIGRVIVVNAVGLFILDPELEGVIKLFKDDDTTVSENEKLDSYGPEFNRLRLDISGRYAYWIVGAAILRVVDLSTQQVIVDGFKLSKKRSRYIKDWLVSPDTKYLYALFGADEEDEEDEYLKQKKKEKAKKKKAKKKRKKKNRKKKRRREDSDYSDGTDSHSGDSSSHSSDSESDSPSESSSSSDSEDDSEFGNDELRVFDVHAKVEMKNFYFQLKKEEFYGDTQYEHFAVDFVSGCIVFAGISPDLSEEEMLGIRDDDSCASSYEEDLATLGEKALILKTCRLSMEGVKHVKSKKYENISPGFFPLEVTSLSFSPTEAANGSMAKTLILSFISGKDEVDSFLLLLRIESNNVWKKHIVVKKHHKEEQLAIEINHNVLFTVGADLSLSINVFN